MENYTNQIREYELNYQSAIEKIKTICDKLDNLYSAFNNTSGNDIDKIRNDIDNIKNELLSINAKILEAKNKTIECAESCDRCYQKYKNKKYSAFEVGDRKYSGVVNVYIAKDGMIHVSKEYTKKRGIIGTLLLSSAGEYFDDKVISKDEMFNS